MIKSGAGPAGQGAFRPDFSYKLVVTPCKENMSKGKFISDFERDIIRIGYSTGATQAQIARFCHRSKSTICVQIQKMIEDGTIDNLPLSFVCDEIGGAIREKG